MSLKKESLVAWSDHEVRHGHLDSSRIGWTPKKGTGNVIELFGFVFCGLSPEVRTVIEFIIKTNKTNQVWGSDHLSFVFQTLD